MFFFFEDCVHFDIYSMNLLAFVFSSLHVLFFLSVLYIMYHDCEICFTISILSFMMSTVLFKLCICLLYMYVHQCIKLINTGIVLSDMCFVLHFVAYQPHIAF